MTTIESDGLEGRVRKLERWLKVLSGALVLLAVLSLVGWSRLRHGQDTTISATEYNLVTSDGTVVGTWMSAEGYPTLIQRNHDWTESTWIHPGLIAVQAEASEIELGKTDKGFAVLVSDSAGNPSIRLLKTELGGGLALYGSLGSHILAMAAGESGGIGYAAPDGTNRVSLTMEGAGQKLRLTDKAGKATWVVGFGTGEDGVDIPLLFLSDEEGDLAFDGLGTIREDR